MAIKKMSTSARFWLKVKVGTKEECWPWLGGIDSFGYGRFDADGVTIHAHRFSYVDIRGSIPEGMHLDHKCHKVDGSCVGGVKCLHRRCANPYHVEPETRVYNATRSVNAFRREARTECRLGHALTEENTYRHGLSKACKICRNKAIKRARARGKCKNPPGSTKKYYKEYYQRKKEEKERDAKRTTNSNSGNAG